MHYLKSKNDIPYHVCSVSMVKSLISHIVRKAKLDATRNSQRVTVNCLFFADLSPTTIVNQILDRSQHKLSAVNISSQELV